MARKTADADVDSLPLSLLPRFASISSTFARREKSDGIHVRDGRHTIILFDIFSLVRTFRRSKLTNRQVNSRIETHRTGSQTRFYLYFDVFAPDFCVEVNSFTRRWINVQRTEERGWGGSFAYWPLFVSIESIRNCSSREFDREDSLLIAIRLALWLEISRWWIEKSDKQNYRYWKPSFDCYEKR